MGDAEALLTERKEKSGKENNLYIILRVYTFI